MSPEIFITGATGYIGGDTLHALYTAHPEYTYACLVRSQEKGNLVTKAYPKVRLVIGGLDDSQLIEDEAARADVVLHTADASDNEGAAKAIAKGLARGHTKENPGYWLHTGGTGILTFWDSRDDFKGLGTWSDREYNDLDGVSDLTSLPDDAFHRNVDKIVLEAGTKYGDVVKTAIVCPPTIYGKGRGPSAVRGRQVYELAKLILTKQYTPIIGEGKARWNHVHVADLADVFVLLTEKAIAKDTSLELWGERGYIIVENGEHVWGDLSRLISRTAAEKGYIKEPEEGALGKDEAIEQAGFEAVSWGLNSRVKALRAKKFLTWTPTRPSLGEEVPTILAEEKERLDAA